MEIGNVFHSAAFIKRLRIPEVDEGYQALQRTSHQNLVNIMDISISHDAINLTYERTGLSLTEIKEHGPVMFDTVTVATICREV
jgi:hypothetical protein